MNVKKNKLYIFILFILLVLTGCTKPINDSKKLEGEIIELKEEIKELKSIVSTYEDLYGDLDLDTKDKDKELEEKTINDGISKVKEIGFQELEEVEDYYEFSIEKSEFKQRVEPSNPDSFYTYYEVKDPKDIYLDTVINFKNKSTINMSVEDVIKVKVIYDKKYKYSSFVVGENSGRGNFEVFTRLEPLTECKAHSIAKIPIEVMESEGPVELLITIYGNMYKLKIK